MNATALLLLAVASPQGPASKPDSPAAPVPTAVAAVRTTTAPVLNRFDSDPAWADAPVISEFRVFRPTDGAMPKFRTEAKVLYDERDLYVLVRAYDPHPDSIVGLLARRDVQTPSDMITVFIDSYHDRRTGYEFDVNPVGVKTDYAIYKDGNEDGAWDGIWDVATKVDSLGWIAVFRFPLSQMRFAVGASNT
ncbi:MAG TPA: carbohydrate binding family 9 domain-containing protein, partial [Gemmatimonadales bacterium]|nr:carbohydrate binding family 9 domain-containing protein [Gemmatimonadales bacterium]